MANYKGNMQKHIKAMHRQMDYFVSRSVLRTMTSLQILLHLMYKAAPKLSLQKHVLSVHEGLKYPFSQCNYKSTQQVNLQKHV